jgi:hypothetical protein
MTGGVAVAVVDVDVALETVSKTVLLERRVSVLVYVRVEVRVEAGRVVRSVAVRDVELFILYFLYF